MNSPRSSLPNLGALTVLEAAGRHQSFSAAALELNVSQAAVSKRVRQLEDWLGVTLFERVGRGVRTTAAGDRLVARLGLSFDFIEETIAELRSPDRPPVRLASMTAVAMFWLQPRLRGFALGDRACDVALTLTDNPAELLTEAHDLVLIYGDGQVPGWDAVPILPEALQPVCAPDLAQGAQTLSDLEGRAPLLDFPRQGPDWIDWTRWSMLPGAAEISGWPRRESAIYAQTIGLALRGGGIALGSLPLMEDEIQAERLVPLGPGPVDAGRGYWLLTRADTAMRPQSRALHDFLCDVANGARG